jgi:ATP-dependent DNA helicase RecQ
MKDIWLSYYKNEQITGRVKNLQAGDKLFLPKDTLSGLLDAEGKTVVKYSTSFKQKLHELIKKGFKPEQAEVAHVVIWFSDDDSRNSRVALPRLGLRKDLDSVAVMI